MLITAPFMHRTPRSLTNACLPHLPTNLVFLFSDSISNIHSWKAFFALAPKIFSFIYLLYFHLSVCASTWSGVDEVSLKYFVGRPSGGSLRGYDAERVSPEELQPRAWWLVFFKTWLDRLPVTWHLLSVWSENSCLSVCLCLSVRPSVIPSVLHPSACRQNIWSEASTDFTQTFFWLFFLVFGRMSPEELHLETWWLVFLKNHLVYFVAVCKHNRGDRMKI